MNDSGCSEEGPNSGSGYSEGGSETSATTGDTMDRESLSWTTETRENAYSCPGFSIVHETVTLPDGTQTDFDYLHDEPSVVVLPFTPDGDLVLIEEWRQAIKRVTRGFPAGGLEPGEDPREAAHRELTEETGYEATRVRTLATFEPATGISDATFHYVVANGCRPTGSQNLDDDESIRVETGTLEELFRALLQGELRDGRTALGVLYYAFERVDPVSMTSPGSP